MTFVRNSTWHTELLCNYYIRILGKVEKILGRTDSLFCGKATAVASVHWTLAKSRLSNPSTTTKSPTPKGVGLFWYKKLILIRTAHPDRPFVKRYGGSIKGLHKRTHVGHFLYNLFPHQFRLPILLCERDINKVNGLVKVLLHNSFYLIKRNPKELPASVDHI